MTSAFGIVHELSKAAVGHLDKLRELAATGRSTTDAAQKALEAGHSMTEINRATLASHVARAKRRRVFKAPS